MKNFFFIFFIFGIFSSCTKDESLDPRPLLISSPFVKLDITDKFMNADNQNDFVFGGLLTTPANNVKSYELFVRCETNLKVILGPYVRVPLEINTFPYDLKISQQLLANTLNIPLSALKAKYSFRFLGYAINEDGKRFDYNSLSSVVKINAGSKQAFKFKTELFNNSDFINQIKPENYIKYDNYAL